MKKILLKLAFTFSAVLFYQNTYAAEIMDVFSNMEIFPTGFNDKINTNLEIVINGEPDLPSKKKPFAFHKSQELKWSVNSTPCASNKNQRCIGIYEQPLPGTLTGNQANFLADIISNSTYTLLKVDKSNFNNNTIYKCKSKYINKSSFRDSANINCSTYKKESCKAWKDFTTNSKNIDSFNNLMANAEKCEQFTKEIKTFSTEINKTFTIGVDEKAKTDISVNFDSVTKPQRGGISPFRTDSNVQPLNINSSIFVYNDIIEKTKDCAKFAEFFDLRFNSNLSEKRNKDGTIVPQIRGTKTIR